MAPGANHGKPEQGSSQVFNTVEIVLGLKLGGDRSSFRRGWVHADESGCDLLVQSGIGQQVPSKLPSNEFVHGQVLVHCPYYPVAVGIDPPLVVQVKPMSISIADGIQPIPGLVLAVARVGKKRVHQTIVSVGVLVPKEGIQSIRLGREPGQGQGHSPRQIFTRGLRGKILSLSTKSIPNEVIHRVSPCLVASLGPDESPVLGVPSTRQGPFLENFLLLRGEGLVELLGRHRFILVEDSQNQLALLGILFVHRIVATEIPLGRLLRVQSDQILLSGIGPVADEALIGKNRQDFAGKVDFRRKSRKAGMKNPKRHETGNNCPHGHEAPATSLEWDPRAPPSHPAI